MAASADAVTALRGPASLSRPMSLTDSPSRKLRTAIVGLGFGAEFIPIHQRHPQAQLVAICQRSRLFV
jgi:hypothetical protein